VIPTKVRLRLLRYISIVSLAACRVGVPLGLLVLVVSFLRPQIALEKLYAASNLAEGVGLGAIFVSLTIVWVLHALGSPLPACRKVLEQLRRRKYSWPAQIIGAIGIVLGMLFMSGVLPSPRMVQPSHGKWITTGFGGSSEVSPSAAKVYLWRDISLYSFFLFVSAYSIAAASRRLLRSMRLSGWHEDAAGSTQQCAGKD
jgi:hypothetical protein